MSTQSRAELALADHELIRVLKSSLYPGAAERDGALPPEVALAWDLVLARVVDETIEHRDRRGRL